MIQLDDARDRVLAGFPTLEPIDLPLAEAHGCVVAESVVSDGQIPPFDNTAMDGYAVRAADTAEAPVVLAVVGHVPAGRPPEGIHVGAGQAARIMTGAPLPPGADAVVMVERTSPSADGSTVEIEVAVRDGNHIRRAGEDVENGDAVVGPGLALTPGRIGLLASVGRRTVSVHPRARVGVLSTGDELVDDGRPLRPGEIRDSNRATLLAMVEEVGCTPIDLGLVPDDEAGLRAAIAAAVGRCDAVLTSGGVSMGDYDYVKVVLDDLGDMQWMQVAIKPAKPLAFGVVDGTPVVGLPGNPVSSMVSFEIFARPALRQMMGHRSTDRPHVLGVADGDLLRRPDGKIHFARVVVTYAADGRYHVRSAGGQGSHQLAAMANANGLAVVPDGDGVAIGETVGVMLLGVVDQG